MSSSTTPPARKLAGRVRGSIERSDYRPIERHSDDVARAGGIYRGVPDDANGFLRREGRERREQRQSDDSHTTHVHGPSDDRREPDSAALDTEHRS